MTSGDEWASESATAARLGLVGVAIAAGPAEGPPGGDMALAATAVSAEPVSAACTLPAVLTEFSVRPERPLRRT